MSVSCLNKFLCILLSLCLAIATSPCLAFADESNCTSHPLARTDFPWEAPLNAFAEKVTTAVDNISNVVTPIVEGLSYFNAHPVEACQNAYNSVVSAVSSFLDSWSQDPRGTLIVTGKAVCETVPTGEAGPGAVAAQAGSVELLNAALNHHLTSVENRGLDYGYYDELVKFIHILEKNALNNSQDEVLIYDPHSGEFRYGRACDFDLDSYNALLTRIADDEVLNKDYNICVALNEKGVRTEMGDAIANLEANYSNMTEADRQAYLDLKNGLDPLAIAAQNADYQLYTYATNKLKDTVKNDLSRGAVRDQLKKGNEMAPLQSSVGLTVVQGALSVAEAANNLYALQAARESSDAHIQQRYNTLLALNRRYQSRATQPSEGVFDDGYIEASERNRGIYTNPDNPPPDAKNYTFYMGRWRHNSEVKLYEYNPSNLR